MPYNKNKQQAFQSAQQAYVQFQEALENLHSEDADYGHQQKLVEQELDEAFQAIQKAHATATEHQKKQLEVFTKDMHRYKQQMHDL
ncbi:hypothetical protein MM300_23255 [Evansella sp. LMS18]|uniref:hypothetical protein n=1 Tax=Evansella sp. LMS18 TaxID=2924033 RepID=UPI0020D0BA2B|nr:hypothetical protein [Evansella sp. LMS18]UTR10727.1 hypothetical protein MM300_23255 [Evansella sp. LMS18]